MRLDGHHMQGREGCASGRWQRCAGIKKATQFGRMGRAGVRKKRLPGEEETPPPAPRICRSRRSLQAACVRVCAHAVPESVHMRWQSIRASMDVDSDMRTCSVVLQGAQHLEVRLAVLSRLDLLHPLHVVHRVCPAVPAAWVHMCEAAGRRWQVDHNPTPCHRIRRHGRHGGPHLSLDVSDCGGGGDSGSNISSCCAECAGVCTLDGGHQAPAAGA